MTPLAQRALLGLARAGVAPGSTPDADLPPAIAALVAGAPPEQALLLAAGVLAVYRNAGAVPSRAIATPEPCADDTMLHCTPAQAHALLEVWEDDALLALTCARLAHAGRVLSPALLLRALAVTPPQRRAALGPLFGARGPWLARQHAPWAWALPERHTADALAQAFIDSTDRLARLSALTDLRRLDPARARALLESTWRGERADARLQLLLALRVAPGPDDEPFLEACLSDRSAPIRLNARTLLARQPGSALVARMTARARDLVRWVPAAAAPVSAHAARRLERVARLVGPELHRAAKLLLTPPLTLAAGATADALGDAFPGAGDDRCAAWACQVLGDTPPAAWLAPLDPVAAPEAVLAALTPDASLLALALARAVATHAVRPLARPLGRWLALTAEPGDRHHADAIAALTAVMLPLEDGELAALLRKSATLAHVGYGQTLGLAATPWAPDVGQAFCEALLDSLGPGGALAQAAPHPFLAEALRDAPVALPDALVVPLLQVLRPRLGGARPGPGAAATAHFLERLTLRARVLAATTDPAAP